MTTRELLGREIDRLPDEQVETLYRHARRLRSETARAGEPGIMSKLRGVVIDEEPDFAETLDERLRGRRHEGPDVH